MVKQLQQSLAPAEMGTSCQAVLRDGVFPQLTDEQLVKLLTALETDDIRLVQGCTTRPPPQQCVKDWPCEAACVLGFCGWGGDESKTVGDVEQYFAEVCFEADRLLGEPAAVRHFLNWVDDAPRGEMRRLLLKEVKQEQERRSAINEECDVPVMVKLVFPVINDRAIMEIDYKELQVELQ